MKSRSKVLSGIILPFALLSSMLVPANGAVASDEFTPIKAASLSEPNDPMFHQQWNLHQTKIPQVWEKTKGKGQIIAVIDTGIIAEHPDLEANILPGYDMIQNPLYALDGDGRDINPRDQGTYPSSKLGICPPDEEKSRSSWHGTFVAGITSAIANNGIGIVGVAPESKILPVRVIGNCGAANPDIADAVLWASGAKVEGSPLNPNQATVINISMDAIHSCPNEVQNAINYAVSKNIPVITSSGNHKGDASASFPGNCNNVINVAASDSCANITEYSNTGSAVDIVAPGAEEPYSNCSDSLPIISTSNPGTTSPVEGPADGFYVKWKGTSYAAPLVSGVVSMMLSINPNLNPAQIETIIKNNAIAMPACGTKCGAGMINPEAIMPELQITNTGIVITGERVVGQKLIASSYYWSTPNLSLQYQWIRDSQYIIEATGQEYVFTSADIGSTLKVEVVASKKGYTTASFMGESVPSVIKPGEPRLIGKYEVGETLSIDPGNWTPSNVKFYYQWFVTEPYDERLGYYWMYPIPHATEPQYKIQESDKGKHISVRLEAYSQDHTSIDVYSNLEAAPLVTDPIPAISTTLPTINGISKVGGILTANSGQWGPDGISLSYQWNSEGSPILGAISQKYTIQANDLGKSLSVTVTGMKEGYKSVTLTSIPTAPVAKGSLITTPAAISGTVKVGNRLTVNHAPWGPAPVAITYQWYRSGVLIPGATASSYMLIADDRGKIMTVHVTGRKTGYTAVYRKSAATVAVAYGDLKGSFPTLSGTPEVNNTLVASPGLWTTGVTVSYQWYRDGVLVTGASGRYYKLTSADLGKQIKVRVLGKKTGYVSRAYYSLSTAKVVPFPPGGSYLFP